MSGVLTPLRDARRRPLRSALTAAGIAIGVAALVILGALSEKMSRLVAGGRDFATGQITVSGAGTPQIALRTVQIDPPALMLGGKLHVHLVVENTGQVPLRTQGPDSGFIYSTND